MNGDDSKSNLIRLFAREHYTAHALLVKIYKNTQYISSLICAFRFMSIDSHNGNRNNNRKYDWCRKLFVENHPSKTEEGRLKIINGIKNKFITRICICGCNETFEVNIKSDKKFLPNHFQKIQYENDSKKTEQSERLKNFNNSLTQE
jgi:hypothetical protein